MTSLEDTLTIVAVAFAALVCAVLGIDAFYAGGTLFIGYFVISAASAWLFVVKALRIIRR